MLAERNPDFLDPALAYTPESWQVLAATGNGLLTFRREPGRRGATVVPDLAKSLPVVSDGGRTLTFVLRGDVRFGPPENRGVRPSDVEATFVRLIRMRSRNWRVYSSIVGADQLASSGRGALAGVRADDLSGRIVFRLRRAEPGFLSKLALPFAHIVPAGTPLVDQSAKPPAATGPYRVADYAPGARIVLERNPAFRPRSTDITDGYVNRIVMRIGLTTSQALREIGTGNADYTQSRVSGPALAEMRPGRLRVRRSVEPETHYVFMNVTVAPFDDIRVRRAVELALDRRRISRLFGGQAVPTAQLLPPTAPGFRRAPIPRPALPRARSLVRRAGANGATVTVWGHSSGVGPAVTREIARALTSIGLRARVRVEHKPTLLTRLGNRRSAAQIGYVRWHQTTPEGDDWFSLLDGRGLKATGNLNYSYLNDATVNRAIASARGITSGTRRAAAWSAVERLAARRIAIAPLANSVRIDAVGDRVGGYTFHQVYGFLWSRAFIRP